MSAIQQYLRNGGVLEALTSDYAISLTRHNKYNNLILFKYNQLDSPPAHPLVINARGLILDEANNWEVICCRFDRFFNYGEGHAAQIDWASARVQEKVDGSLMTVYFYDGKWHVATSGSPHAGGQVGDFPFTFAELFWNTWSGMGYATEFLNPELCYSFEMTSQYNRVVVRYTEPSLTLIGVHRKDWNMEYPLEYLTRFKAVKTFDLTSFDAITESFATIDPLSQEGYIVVDANFNRVKMKNPAYVAIHHLKDGFGYKRITEIVRTSETSEFLTYFPEYSPQFNEVQTAYDALVLQLENVYDSIKHIESQRDFALAVQASKISVSGALYNLRSGKVTSFKQYLREMNLDNLMNALGLK